MFNDDPSPLLAIGQLNTLEVVKEVDFGVYLYGDEDYGNVLLPKRYVPEGTEKGDRLEVFVYFDSEDQIIATTETPLAMVGEFALLKVVGLTKVGAFADWGLSKDLLVPFSEQRKPLEEGKSTLFYLYIDNASGRIVGTTKFNKYLDKTPPTYERGEEVSLQIAEITDLGYKAVVNGEHWGLLFRSESFGKLFIGKQLKGYIQAIRADGKIDLSLQKLGREKLDDLAEKILASLERRGGFLPIGDKSSPEEIFSAFKTSKATYKKTIGNLKKRGLILIEKEGIRSPDE